MSDPVTKPQRRGTLMPNMLLGFGIALLVVALAGFVTYRAARDFAQSAKLVGHTQQVLEVLASLEVGYAEMVGAVRGYVITERPSYLEQRRDAAVEMHAALDTLQVLTRDNPRQSAALDQLRSALALREGELVRALAAHAAGGIEAVRSLSADPAIAEATEDVRALLERLNRDESRLLAERSELDARHTAQLRNTLLAFFGCTVVILSLLFVRARNALRRREAAEREGDWQRRFSDAIIDNAPMGIYLKDAAELKLIRLNRFVEEMMGVPRAALLGKDDRAFYPADVAAGYLASERAILDAGEKLTATEVVLETPAGRRVLDVKKVPLQDEQGKPAFLMGIFQDITERRNAEDRQRESAEQLEIKSRELEIANRELESFSYSVSHDLRAPLRAVNGYAVMLEEDHSHQLDQEGHRYLRTIQQAAARMGALIEDLLAFSRLGRQAIQPVGTNTRELVTAAWDSVRAAHPHARAQLAVGELPESYGDPRLLLQVWTNLLENAVKYSDKVAEPRVEVSGAALDTETVFRIRDNGVGFDMRYYDKLFNVFQRLHSEGEYAGSGVGLAIVQRIAHRHGGRSWAESAPGKGASFYFALPAAAVSSADFAKAG